MRTLLCILLLAGFTASAAIETVNAPPLGNAVFRFYPHMSVSTITGMVQSLPTGTLKWFTPGTYIIPTNNTSWAKPSVTNLFHFDEGAVLFFGNSSDNSGSLAAPVPIFTDVGGAMTLIVSGSGTFVASNKSSPILHIEKAGSIADFRGLDLIRYNTNQQTAVVYQKGDAANTINLEVRDIINTGYDGYWNNGGTSGRIRLRARAILAADSAVEYPAGPTNMLQCDMVVGTIEHYKQTYFPSTGNVLVQLAENCHLRVTTGIFTGTNSWIYGVGSSDYTHLDDGAGTIILAQPATLETPLIMADPLSKRTPVRGTGLRLVGTTIIGPEAFDAVLIGINGTAGEAMHFEACRIVNPTVLAFGATNSIRSIGTNHAVGTFTFELPVDAKTICQGNWATTNTFDTTLTADNQVVRTAGVKYLKLSSDNATAGNRTFTLVSTTMSMGQVLTLEWVGTNAGELVDDAAMAGGGNARLAGTWTPTQYDTITLEYNGTDIVERGRSTN